jgi:hypothetical protein
LTSVGFSPYLPWSEIEVGFIPRNLAVVVPVDADQISLMMCDVNGRLSFLS